MQRTIFSDPPSLPSPPWLEHALYESPWVLAIGIAVAGVVAWWFLHQARRRKAGAAAGLIGLAAGGGVIALATSVTTDREAMVARSISLIDAVRTADSATLNTLLSDSVALDLLGTRSGRRKAEIVRAVSEGGGVAARYGADQATIVPLGAVMDNPSTARVQMRVNVPHPRGGAEQLGSNIRTTWLVIWRKTAQNTWQVSTIEAQEIGLLPQGAARW
ncbi:MAG: hypothetical protein MUE97_00970 [Phycisphaerales bacterium]|nr:hypothetical protein [Phycisphaerales bacterium]